MTCIPEFLPPKLRSPEDFFGLAVGKGEEDFLRLFSETFHDDEVQDETGPDPLLNWYLTEPVPTGRDAQCGG